MIRKIGFGLLLSAVFTVLLLRNVSWADLRESLSRVNYWIIVPLTALTLLTTLLRSWRWLYLLAPVKTVGVVRLFSANSIGFMANMIFPARLGEFVRAYVLGRNSRLSASTAFATIVVERLYDGFSVLCMLVAVTLFSALPLPEDIRRLLRWGGWLSFLLYIVLLSFLVLLRQKPEPAHAVIGKLLFWVSPRLRHRVRDLLESFSMGLRVLGSPGHSLGVGLFSAILWVFYGFINYVILAFFGLQVPVAGLFLLIVFQAFGVMLPSSPGFVGTYHAATVAGLTLLGISKTLALSVSIVMHAMLVLPTVVIGLFFLWWENLSLAEVGKIGKETEPSAG